MTMVTVLVVVLAVVAIGGALEVARRAAAGRRMERFYDTLRPAERDLAPPSSRPARVRRRPAVPVVDRRVPQPVRRAS